MGFSPIRNGEWFFGYLRRSLIEKWSPLSVQQTDNRRRIKICFPPPPPLRWGTFFNYWGDGGWVISNSLKSSFSPNMWQQITLWCYCYSLPAFADWPAPIQISYFIGPYSLHYLLFSGIVALFCHYPYCFPSQSKTLFGIGAGQPCVWEVILYRKGIWYL